MTLTKGSSSEFPALSANVEICILTKLRELYILPILELAIFCNYLNDLKNVAFFYDSMWVFPSCMLGFFYFVFIVSFVFVGFVFVVLFFSFFWGVLSTNCKQTM